MIGYVVLCRQCLLSELTKCVGYKMLIAILLPRRHRASHNEFNMTTLHFRVTGLVQHVWFRGWTIETARGLGLVGWVRNMPDGSVAGQAQARDGSEQGRAALERFRALLSQGPPSARVDLVDAGYIDIPDRFEDFSVRR